MIRASAIIAVMLLGACEAKNNMPMCQSNCVVAQGLLLAPIDAGGNEPTPEPLPLPATTTKKAK